MYDVGLLRDKLEQIAEALTRIERRFTGIQIPEDFIASELNRDKLDGIAMLLIAIGESFKKIDKETTGTFLVKYPAVDWKGVIGTRNILAHAYFDIDIEEVFIICHRDIPTLHATVRQMLNQVE